MANVVDITGKRFGMLVAIEPTKERISKHIVWKCKCDCGNICYVTSNNLLNGHKKSCNCLRKKVMSKQSKLWKENVQEGRGTHDGTVDCALNSRPYKSNNTGVRGVYIQNGKFRVQKKKKNKRYHIGCFDTLKEAKEVRKIAEKEIWGKEL